MATPQVKDLVLHSPAGSSEVVTFSWPLQIGSGQDKHDNGIDIIDTIKFVCEELPGICSAFEEINLYQIDTACYKTMTNLVDRFNKAVDSIVALEKGTSLPTERLNKFAHPSLLRHILQLVYNAAVSDPDKLNNYEPFSPEVYGETSYELVQQMIKHVSVSNDDTFIDLGSGVGQVVLQMAGSFPLKTCIGIEKADVPSRYAERMDTHFRQYMAWFGKRFCEYKLLKGDFLVDEHREKITSSTLVFVNNFAFGPNVDHQLKERFADLRDGARIVSSKSFCPLNFRITDRNLSDIGTIMHVSEIPPLKGSVSWTCKPVSYYLHVIDRTILERYFQRLKTQKATEHDNVGSTRTTRDRAKREANNQHHNHHHHHHHHQQNANYNSMNSSAQHNNYHHNHNSNSNHSNSNSNSTPLTVHSSNSNYSTTNNNNHRKASSHQQQMDMDTSTESDGDGGAITAPASTTTNGGGVAATTTAAGGVTTRTTRKVWSDWCSSKGKSSQSDDEENNNFGSAANSRNIRATTQKKRKKLTRKAAIASKSAAAAAIAQAAAAAAAAAAAEKYSSPVVTIQKESSPAAVTSVNNSSCSAAAEAVAVAAAAAGAKRKGRMKKGGRGKKSLKIVGLDVLHTQTLLSTSAEMMSKKLPPAPGCVDQQLTSLLTGDMRHTELDIPPAPSETPYALQILLDVIRSQYMAMIEQMKSKSFMPNIMQQIQIEQERKQRIKNRASQLDKQIKVLIDDSVALLKVRMNELCDNMSSPNDLLAKAKEIVGRHKELQGRAKKIQNQVSTSELEYKRSLIRSLQSFPNFQKFLNSVRNKNDTATGAGVTVTLSSSVEITEAAAHEFILKEIANTLAQRKKLYAKVSFHEKEYSILEKAVEERKTAALLLAQGTNLTITNIPPASKASSSATAVTAAATTPTTTVYADINSTTGLSSSSSVSAVGSSGAAASLSGTSTPTVTSANTIPPPLATNNKSTKSSRRSRDHRTRSQEWPDVPDVGKIEESNPEVLAQKILETGRQIEAGKIPGSSSYKQHHKEDRKNRNVAANANSEMHSYGMQGQDSALMPAPQQGGFKQQHTSPVVGQASSSSSSNSCNGSSLRGSTSVLPKCSMPGSKSNNVNTNIQESPKVANFEDRLKSIITSALNEDQEHRKAAQQQIPSAIVHDVIAVVAPMPRSPQQAVSKRNKPHSASSSPAAVALNLQYQQQQQQQQQHQIHHHQNLHQHLQQQPTHNSATNNNLSNIITVATQGLTHLNATTTISPITPPLTPSAAAAVVAAQYAAAHQHQNSHILPQSATHHGAAGGYSSKHTSAAQYGSGGSGGKQLQSSSSSPVVGSASASASSSAQKYSSKTTSAASASASASLHLVHPSSIVPPTSVTHQQQQQQLQHHHQQQQHQLQMQIQQSIYAANSSPAAAAAAAAAVATDLAYRRGSISASNISYEHFQHQHAAAVAAAAAHHQQQQHHPSHSSHHTHHHALHSRESMPLEFKTPAENLMTTAPSSVANRIPIEEHPRSNSASSDSAIMYYPPTRDRLLSMERSASRDSGLQQQSMSQLQQPSRPSSSSSQPDYTQVSPAKMALRRHLSQEKLAQQHPSVGGGVAGASNGAHPPPTTNSIMATKTIGDLVNGEIERTLENERTLEISHQSIINAVVNMSTGGGSASERAAAERLMINPNVQRPERVHVRMMDDPHLGLSNQISPRSTHTTNDRNGRKSPLPSHNSSTLAQVAYNHKTTGGQATSLATHDMSAISMKVAVNSRDVLPTSSTSSRNSIGNYNNNNAASSTTAVPLYHHLSSSSSSSGAPTSSRNGGGSRSRDYPTVVLPRAEMKGCIEAYFNEEHQQQHPQHSHHQHQQAQHLQKSSLKERSSGRGRMNGGNPPLEGLAVSLQDHVMASRKFKEENEERQRRSAASSSAQSDSSMVHHPLHYAQHPQQQQQHPTVHGHPHHPHNHHHSGSETGSAGASNSSQHHDGYKVEIGIKRTSPLVQHVRPSKIAHYSHEPTTTHHNNHHHHNHPHHSNPHHNHSHAHHQSLQIVASSSVPSSTSSSSSSSSSSTSSTSSAASSSSSSASSSSSSSNSIGGGGGGTFGGRAPRSSNLSLEPPPLMSPEINSLMGDDRPMPLVSARQTQPPNARNGAGADDDDVIADDETHWQDRVSSGFDRLVAFASTELDKTRRSIDADTVPSSISCNTSPDSGITHSSIGSNSDARTFLSTLSSSSSQLDLPISSAGSTSSSSGCAATDHLSDSSMKSSHSIEATTSPITIKSSSVLDAAASAIESPPLSEIGLPRTPSPTAAATPPLSAKNSLAYSISTSANAAPAKNVTLDAHLAANQHLSTLKIPLKYQRKSKVTSSEKQHYKKKFRERNWEYDCSDDAAMYSSADMVPRVPSGASAEDCNTVAAVPKVSSLVAMSTGGAGIKDQESTTGNTIGAGSAAGAILLNHNHNNHHHHKASKFRPKGKDWDWSMDSSSCNKNNITAASTDSLSLG